MGVTVRPSRDGVIGCPPELADRYTARGYWLGQALGEQVLGVARAWPDAVAVTDAGVRLTYRELAARVDGAALRLRELGLRADDRILVQLPNCWQFVVLALACFRLGALPVMTLLAHRQHEISYLAGKTQARAIAVPGKVKGFDHQAMAHELSAGSPYLAHVLVSGHTGGGSKDLDALCAPAADPGGARAQLDAGAPDSRAVALFLLSGGTTAEPKLIARTHDDYAYYARRTAEICRFGPDTVNLLAMPVGHNFSLGVLLAMLSVGGHVVLARSPSPEVVFPLIEQQRVTNTGAVPAVIQRWMEFRESNRRHDLSSLRSVMVGGAKLPDDAAERVTPTLGCTLQQGYGMAEGLVCLTRLDDPADVICRTQGRPLSDDDELLVVDESGRPVPPGEPGALLTRGPYTPRGYYLAPEQNAVAFLPDGWYRTGDIVRLDPGGNVIVVGRDKDMINRGGEKISAEEVENFAYQVDGVTQAAAVAMPDEQLGERVCLFVVLRRPGTRVYLEDVLAVMRHAGVARFKLPERLVVVDSLPMTAMQKIDKKALRADIVRRLDAERAAARSVTT